MDDARAMRSSSKAKVWSALATVYVVWGSTYLFIRFAVETLPPHMAAGVRFIVAGLALYAFARARGAPRPTPARWRFDGLIGALLLLGGNGPVMWAASRVPSGLSALLVAMTPLWMMSIGAAQERRVPSLKTALGVLMGLVGLGLLVGERGGQHSDQVDWLAALALVGASLSWSVGSMIARGRPPSAPLLSTGMQMLVGGALLLLLGVVEGEPAAFSLAAASARSVWSLVYLCTVGSIVGYSAYAYLLQNTSAATASTYAYVNPVVAVGLGAAFAGEALTPRMAAATLVIVASVALVVTTRR